MPVPTRKMASLASAVTVAALCVLSINAGTGAAEGDDSGQELKLRFTRRHPRSTVSAIIRDLGFDPGMKGNRRDYDLSRMAFRVYVPKNYDRRAPHGIVYVTTTYTFVGKVWAPVCDKRRLILVVPEDPRIYMDPVMKIGLALDAVYNMRRRYTIDKERVYVAGTLHSNIHAGVLALFYPRTFRGCLFMCGVWRFWDRRSVPKKRMLPARRQNRFVLFASQKFKAEDRAELRKLYQDHFKNGGFARATYLEAPTGGFEPDTEYFHKCVAFLDGPMIEAAKAVYDRAVSAEKQGSLGQALKLYEEAAAGALGEDFGDKASARVAELCKQRDEKIAAAKTAAEAKDYATAISALNDVVRQFGEAAGEATALLDELRKNPKIRDVLRAAEEEAASRGKEEAAAKALASARRLLEKDTARGYQALRDVAKRYPGTQAAAEAAGEAEKLWDDPAKRRLLEGSSSSRRAKSLLGSARNFMANGMDEQARSRLKKIVEEYPDTPEAEEARKLLDRLK